MVRLGRRQQLHEFGERHNHWLNGFFEYFGKR